MTSTLAIAALALASAGTSTHYDCSIERQFVITADGGKWNDSQVVFPGTQKAQWAFSLDLVEGAADEPAMVSVKWPRDLVQIAGEHPALRLAPGHYAFAAGRGGGCMFTEEACLALVEIADRDDASASVLIAPAGLSRNQDTGQRSLLQVTSVGSCRRSQTRR